MFQSPHTRTCGYSVRYALSLKCFREKDAHSTAYKMKCLSHHKLVLKLGKFCKMEFYVLSCKTKIIWISCMDPQQIKFGENSCLVCQHCVCTPMHLKAWQWFCLHPRLLIGMYICKIKSTFKLTKKHLDINSLYSNNLHHAFWNICHLYFHIRLFSDLPS